MLTKSFLSLSRRNFQYRLIESFLSLPSKVMLTESFLSLSLSVSTLHPESPIDVILPLSLSSRSGGVVTCVLAPSQKPANSPDKSQPLLRHPRHLLHPLPHRPCNSHCTEAHNILHGLSKGARRWLMGGGCSMTACAQSRVSLEAQWGGNGLGRAIGWVHYPGVRQRSAEFCSSFSCFILPSSSWACPRTPRSCCHTVMLLIVV
jgi:hypothetical protein